MKLTWFYAIGIGGSWFIWIVGGWIFPSIDPLWIIIPGGLGPILAALVYLAKATPKERKQYWNRFKMVKNISIPVWLVTIFSPFLFVFLANAVAIFILKSNGSIFGFEEAFVNAIVMTTLFTFLFGPLPEEIAWRGIGFERLLSKGYYKTQLVVGLLWLLWHIPLFGIEGSYQATLGWFTEAFWMYQLNLVFASIVVGWVYVFGNRSILLAVIYHFFVNLSGNILRVEGAPWLYTLIFGLFACIILLQKPSKNHVTIQEGE